MFSASAGSGAKNTYLPSGMLNCRVTAPLYHVPVRKKTGPLGWPLVAHRPSGSNPGCVFVGQSHVHLNHSAVHSDKVLPPTTASLGRTCAWAEALRTRLTKRTRGVFICIYLSNDEWMIVGG